MASRTTRSRTIPAATYGNRVVGRGEVAAGQLLGNEMNWRIHPGEQQAVLDEMLTRVGFVQAVVVNRRSSASWGKDRHVETLVDGHLRVQLALSRGEDTPVPVAYVDLTPQEEAAVLATFDPIGALAVTDHEKLADVVAALDDDMRMVTEVLRHERKRKTQVSFEAEQAYEVVVTCENESQRDTLATRLENEGFRCRVK